MSYAISLRLHGFKLNFYKKNKDVKIIILKSYFYIISKIKYLCQVWNNNIQSNHFRVTSLNIFSDKIL